MLIEAGSCSPNSLGRSRGGRGGGTQRWGTWKGMPPTSKGHRGTRVPRTPSDRQGRRRRDPGSIPACGVSPGFVRPACLSFPIPPRMPCSGAEAAGGIRPRVRQAAGLYFNYFGRKAKQRVPAGLRRVPLLGVDITPAPTGSSGPATGPPGCCRPRTPPPPRSPAGSAAAPRAAAAAAAPRRAGPRLPRTPAAPASSRHLRGQKPGGDPTPRVTHPPRVAISPLRNRGSSQHPDFGPCQASPKTWRCPPAPLHRARLTPAHPGTAPRLAQPPRPPPPGR